MDPTTLSFRVEAQANTVMLVSLKNISLGPQTYDLQSGKKKNQRLF
jgi:hypothetical protein